MPLVRCEKDGQPGYRWGETGTCFTGPDGRTRALAVGRAIAANKAELRKSGESSDAIEATEAIFRKAAESVIESLSPPALVAYCETLPARKASFEIRKVDAEQGRVFGWATVVEKDGEMVFDHEGDAIFPEELEEATYVFMKDARAMTDAHDRATIGSGDLIECMFFSKEKQELLGIDLGLIGTWVGFEIEDLELRRAIREGDRLMFSIGGGAARVPL